MRAPLIQNDDDPPGHVKHADPVWSRFYPSLEFDPSLVYPLADIAQTPVARGMVVATFRGSGSLRSCAQWRVKNLAKAGSRRDAAWE